MNGRTGTECREEREDREAQEKRAIAELEAECERTRCAVVELEAAEKLAVLEKERREAVVLRKNNERLLRTLHPIKEKEDLEFISLGWSTSYCSARWMKASGYST